MTMQFPKGMFKGLTQGTTCPACQGWTAIPVSTMLDGGKFDCSKCGAHLKSLGHHFKSREDMLRPAQEGGAIRIDDDPAGEEVTGSP